MQHARPFYFIKLRASLLTRTWSINAARKQVLVCGKCIANMA